MEPSGSATSEENSGKRFEQPELAPPSPGGTSTSGLRLDGPVGFSPADIRPASAGAHRVQLTSLTSASPAGLDQHVRHHPGGTQRLPGGSPVHVHVQTQSLSAESECGPLLFQDNKADVILKYNLDEARSLKAYGELPDHGEPRHRPPSARWWTALTTVPFPQPKSMKTTSGLKTTKSSLTTADTETTTTWMRCVL